MRKNIKSLLTFKVTEDAVLIEFIMEKMYGISRNRAKALITNRVVLVNNAISIEMNLILCMRIRIC